MKTLLSSMFALFLASVCMGQSTMQLKFTGIVQQKGALMVAVFQQNNFNKAPSFAKKVAVDGTSMTVKFENVPEGNYAVMVFQDLNENYKLDRAANGMPTEPYGLSGNPMMAGPPTWEALKFSWDESSEPLSIKIVNN